MKKLWFWVAYAVISLSAQFGIITFSNHPYFAFGMGVSLFIVFIMTLASSVKASKKAAMLWIAFGILLVVQGFPVFRYGLSDISGYANYLLNPTRAFETLRWAPEYISNVGFEGSLSLLHYLLHEIIKFALPIFAVIFMIKGASQKSKGSSQGTNTQTVRTKHQPQPSMDYDVGQTDEQRRREEAELQRKIEEMRRQEENQRKQDEEQRRQKENQRRQDEEIHKQYEANRQKEISMKESASSGDVKAQRELGLMYLEGRDSVLKDAQKAAELFEKAAEQGDVESQFELGYLYRHGDAGFQADIEKGLYWLEKAANSGHSKAQYHLGRLYFDESIQGIIPNDLNKFAYWMEKSAEQGETRAMHSLAALNMMSDYPDANMDTAIGWYKKLSYSHNDAEAMVTLGIFYCKGEEAPRNHGEGMKLINKGVSMLGNGMNPYLSLQLGLLYWDGKTTPEGNADNKTANDMEKTIEYLEKAIGGGLDDENIANLLDVAKKQLDSHHEMINTLHEANELLAKDGLDQLENGIRQVEEVLYSSAFNASKVKEDLQNRKTLESLEEMQRKNLRDIEDKPWMMDMVRSMGVNTTPSRSNSVSLYEKKQFYSKQFDEMSELITTIKGHLKTAKENLPRSKRVPLLVEKCDKCEKELNNLKSIVRSF
jgi:TPR repeat protein